MGWWLGMGRAQLGMGWRLLGLLGIRLGLGPGLGIRMEPLLYLAILLVQPLVGLRYSGSRLLRRRYLLGHSHSELFTPGSLFRSGTQAPPRPDCIADCL
jgi:hypothetical protein